MSGGEMPRSAEKSVGSQAVAPAPVTFGQHDANWLVLDAHNEDERTNGQTGHAVAGSGAPAQRRARWRNDVCRAQGL